MSPDGLPLPRLARWLLLLMGEDAPAGHQVFVHHQPDCDDMFTQIFRRAIAGRYRLAISPLSFLALRQRQFDRPVEIIRIDEERETQVYDCSLYGLRPASH